MDEWEKRMRIYDRAEKMADVDHYITAKGNPLRELEPRHTPAYDYNMRVLERDAARREAPMNGRVYAGIMDNMRYGGNE